MGKWVLPIAAVLAITLAGCAQNADQWLGQKTGQQTTTPTATDQSAATQGTQIYFDISQVPGGAKHGDDPFWAVLAGGDGTETALASAEGVSEGASGVQKAAATFLQSGFSIVITTGGTTPSLTGTATGTATASQAPIQTGTQTPTQEVKPETTASVNAAVAAPGGNADQQTAMSGRGNVTADKKAAQTATNQVLETLASDASLRERFLDLLTNPPPANVSTNGS